MPEPIILKQSAVIGLRNVHYALLTDDTETATTYGVVKRVADAIDAVITPNVETSTIWADDGASESVSALGEINIALELKVIPVEVQVEWFGHTKDAKGIIIKGGNDKPATIALGFKALMANGKYAYKWLLKVTPQLSEEAFHTKESGNVNFQTRKVILIGVTRLSDNNWELGIVEGEPGADAATIAGWLTAVPTITPVVP